MRSRENFQDSILSLLSKITNHDIFWTIHHIEFYEYYSFLRLLFKVHYNALLPFNLCKAQWASQLHWLSVTSEYVCHKFIPKPCWANHMVILIFDLISPFIIRATIMCTSIIYFKSNNNKSWHWVGVHLLPWTLLSILYTWIHLILTAAFDVGKIAQYHRWKRLRALAIWPKFKQSK